MKKKYMTYKDWLCDNRWRDMEFEGINIEKMIAVEKSAMKNLENYEKTPRPIPARPKPFKKKLSSIEYLINNTIIL